MGSGPTLTWPSAAMVIGNASAPSSADILYEKRSSSVDKALCQPLVERIGQSRFDFTRAFRPLGGLLQPVGAMGDIGPASNTREAVSERFDVAVYIIEPGDFGSEPFVGNMAAFANITVESP